MPKEYFKYNSIIYKKRKMSSFFGAKAYFALCMDIITNGHVKSEWGCIRNQQTLNFFKKTLYFSALKW